MTTFEQLLVDMLERIAIAVEDLNPDTPDKGITSADRIEDSLMNIEVQLKDICRALEDK